MKKRKNAGRVAKEPVKTVQEASVPSVHPPRSRIGQWLLEGGRPEESGHEHKTQRPWYAVLWLTGVDYFSTLGYQPGIALLAAGMLSPVATAILVAVTLFGAVPIYSQVAGRSYAGQGSVAMLERLLPGWLSKIFVLVLLGFASTDFVITMTLSAADAAQHMVENPLLHRFLGEARVEITLVLLALLAAVFLKGFGEAIGVAAAVAIPYILLNIVVVARGFWEVMNHPEHLARWTEALAVRGDPVAVLLAAGLIFPRLALGLSGFETGVTVMPLVKGDQPDPPGAVPVERIQATRKLLLSAALLMSVMLLATSFTTTLLIPEEAYRKGGPAAGRAMAYIAHHLMGHTVGSLYDISTILILWFAGASAMAGMLNLIPRYLPRYGMAPRWVAYVRPLVLVLFAVDVLVTLMFKADVEAQGGAYATGVLTLILSAAVAVSLALWEEARQERRFPGASFYFMLMILVFAYTLVDNVIGRPEGMIIASVFIVSILILSGLSRYLRATELRVESLTFEDEASAALWPTLIGKKVNLVPLKICNEAACRRKEADIRRFYRIHGPLAFLHVYLSDDRSEFLSPLRLKIRRTGENYAIEVFCAVAIANTIAYISEVLDPISIILGLTRRNPVVQALQYLLFGEGETGILVYEILLRYWNWTPEDDVRPLIFLMSE